MEVQITIKGETTERQMNAVLAALLGVQTRPGEESPQLVKVMPETPEPAPAAQPANQPQPETQPTPEPEPQMPFDTETDEPHAAETPAQEAPAEPATPAPAAQPQMAPPEPKVTDELLRSHIDNVFLRILGPEYQTLVASNPEAKKDQVRITHFVKQIAAELGAVKPTLLPQGKRWEFIEKLNNIDRRDGQIIMLPF